MPISACFLDVDGVINDHALNPGMWDAHLGEVLAPVLGSTPQEWGRVNRIVFPNIWKEQATWGTVPMSRIRTEAHLVVKGMCEQLGITPPLPERSFELWQQVDRHVASTGKAAYPFAAGAVRELASLVPVHMATGNPSWRVDALLSALGVRHIVGFPAGPDLVDIFKDDPRFYSRIFERTNFPSATALVVDDTPACLAHAKAAGAQTVHIDDTRKCQCPANHHLPTLSELPSIVITIGVAPLSGR